MVFKTNDMSELCPVDADLKLAPILLLVLESLDIHRVTNRYKHPSRVVSVRMTEAYETILDSRTERVIFVNLMK